MSINPLDSAWKIAKEFYDRRQAAPSEIDYFRARGFRDELEEAAYNVFTSTAGQLNEGRYTTQPDHGERTILIRAAYLSTIGFPSLAATLIKLYWVDRRVRTKGS